MKAKNRGTLPRMGLDFVWNWRHLSILLAACVILSAWIGWRQ